MPRNNKFNYIPAPKYNPQRSAKSELAHAKIKCPRKISRHSRSNATHDYLMLYIMKWWDRLTITQRLLFIAALLVLMASGCLIIFSRSSKYTVNKLVKTSGSSDLYFFNTSSLTRVHKSNSYNHLSPKLDKLLIDSDQSSILKNEALNNQVVVVCDNTGICRSESDSASKEVNSSNQDRPNKQNNPLLATAVKEKIVASDYAHKDYQHSNSSLSEDSDFIVKTVEDLAYKNHRMKCKLQTVLKYSPRLKIIITTREDPTAGDNQSVGAQFYPETNTIQIFRNTFADIAFPSFLFHEFHHAFVYYENLKDIYSLFRRVSQIDQHTAIPCFEYGASQVNCEMISQILYSGFRNIDRLFKILAKSSANLDETEANDKELYLDAIKNYKPFRRREIIPSGTILSMKKDHYIDENLNITTKTGFVRIIIQIGPKNRDMYIDKLEKVGNDYYSTLGPARTDEQEKAALIDFDYFYDCYYHQDDATKLIERDAFINQLYEEHPVLLDLLFPGLHEYHFERAGSKYQRCMR